MCMAGGEGNLTTEKHPSTQKTIFYDPTHRRLFILVAVLLALLLAWLYFRLFDPIGLLNFKVFHVLPFRRRFVRVLNRVMLAMLLLHYLKLLTYVALARRSRPPRRDAPTPKVCAVIPAYNEERVIEKTVRSVLASDYGRIDVYVVDDGSADRTAEVVETAFRSDRRVHLLRQSNSGKAAALNRGIAAVNCELLLLLDADTLVAPDAVRLMARHFSDPRVAAVSGNTRVGNVTNLITRCQKVEYIRDFNLIKNGMSRLRCMAVVPGALGMWRRTALMEAGGFSTQTLGEDRDMTMALLRADRRVRFEPLAFSRTEAPATLRAFLRQRFRWTYGTLQCAVKYLRSLFSFRAPGLGFLLLPDLLLFQTLVPCVSALGLLTNLMDPQRSELILLEVSFCLAIVLELLLYLLSTIYTRERPSALDLLTIIPQRILYGVLCTYLIFKALVVAFFGGKVGWNKLERVGNVDDMTQSVPKEV